MPSSQPKLIRFVIASLGVAVALVGCSTLSLEQRAPLVAETPQLARGRTVYVTKCATCHAPEPVLKYTHQQWEKIFPDMIEESKLDAADGSAVIAYVNWVLAHPPAPVSNR